MQYRYKPHFVIIKLLLLLLILGTIVFILSNSMLSKKESEDVSSSFGEFIENIFPPETDFGKILLDNLRKIAHFTEYGFLGILVALYVLIYSEVKLKLAASSVVIPFFVGFIDESIQILSKRGPSVSDVWIDIGGFYFFSLITYLAAFVVGAICFFTQKSRKNALK